jgi:hypothetical protein
LSYHFIFAFSFAFCFLIIFLLLLVLIIPSTLLPVLRVSFHVLSILLSLFADNCFPLITLISSFLFRISSSTHSLHASYSYYILSRKSLSSLFLLSTDHVSSMRFKSESDHFTSLRKSDEIPSQIKILIRDQECYHESRHASIFT